MAEPRTPGSQVKRLKSRVRNLDSKLAQSVPKTELALVERRDIEVARKTIEGRKGPKRH